MPPAPARATEAGIRGVQLGRAWVGLAIALALHIFDEAATGFLSVYNPTVLALRARWPWWPMPTFTFQEWLAGLILADILLLAITPLFYRGGRPLRWFACMFAVLMIGNGMGHILGTIAGRTVQSVHFARPAPGFYSSPLLIAASIWVLMELARTRQCRGRAAEVASRT
ncbi:MAG: hypothetical protein ACRD3E_08785 [Terriglobales bacterium]